MEDDPGEKGTNSIGKTTSRKKGNVAQLVVHLPCMQGVTSSTLVISKRVGGEETHPREKILGVPPGGGKVSRKTRKKKREDSEERGKKIKTRSQTRKKR